MFSEDLARDVQGAELMITQHSELKAEIDTKEEKYVTASALTNYVLSTVCTIRNLIDLRDTVCVNVCSILSNTKKKVLTC